VEAEKVLHLVHFGRVGIHLDEHGESAIVFPGVDKTIVPHGQRVGIDGDILHGN
jgi:hypothetical protein